MVLPAINRMEDFDPRFKVFHELMQNKIRDVLLISAPYDAWILEADCRLSEQIINEYRGLNLSKPPRFHWVTSLDEAMRSLGEKSFDLVIIVARTVLDEAFEVGKAIKKQHPDLFILLLTHQYLPEEDHRLTWKVPGAVDATFMWTGNTDILLALIKGAEDFMNADHDTDIAGIRVIIIVEDSPEYLSSLLPILYKELVIQTQAVIEEGLNQEHRLLAMRARPKVLITGSYEEARQIFKQYEPYVLGVISDGRIPREGKLNGSAGADLLRTVKQDRFDIPLLLISSESRNADIAADIPAVFVDKNSPSLLADVRSFLINHLGFGDFIFSDSHGHRLAQASTLLELESSLETISDESFIFHSRRNDFSRWLFARTEIELASRIRPIKSGDFSNVENHRQRLLSMIHSRRMQRQKGIIVSFAGERFDADTEFLKIGNGSLGGKARGLAFMSSLLHYSSALKASFEDVDISIPKTLVLTTDCFDRFVEKNGLQPLAKDDLPDEEIAVRFTAADFPGRYENQLKAYLAHVRYPLAIRSSSLLEDAQFRAYAGLYKTYMLANDHADIDCRLDQLINAVKMVFASTYFRAPRAFARRVGHRTEEEKMADIVYVKPDAFDPASTKKIARQIGRINSRLLKTGSKYVLIGPGRWGSADHWLGIPVSWADICGVGAIVETSHHKLNAEPSQGSHFFHNLTSLGINYITVAEGKGDHLDWSWLQSQPIMDEESFVARVHLNGPMTLKVDGRTSRCIIHP